MEDPARADLTRRTERWFVKRGLPHFIDEYSATTDVWTRAAPFLTLVFFAELAFSLDEEREGLEELLPVLGGLGIFLVAITAVNLFRGRSPLQRPEKVGTPELAMFVLVPPLLPAIFSHDHATDPLGAVALNLTILLLVYVVTSYALVPMTRWALGQMFRQLADVADLMVRSLPLLLLFATFLFLNTEIWQVAADLEAPFLLLVVGMFLLAGTAFLVIRQRQEVERVGRFDSWGDVLDGCGQAPVCELPVDGLSEPPAPPRLGKRARLNVALVLVFTQGVQIVIVGLVIGLFYVAFGLVAVRETTMLSWVGGKLDTIGEVELFGHPVVLTWDLIRVAGLVAAFSALQFTFSALTDEQYRREFFDGIMAEMREALAARALYLAGLVHGAGGSSDEGGAP
ncbi:MAG TPA: hypothetical protein VD926_02785 [Acidimicrobiales bacterium]|nr:hypothetical protein [Acidimicrobiales bacterium]